MGIEPVSEESLDSSSDEQYKNLFEKKLTRIMKESNYSNVSMIYRKIYKHLHGIMQVIF